MYDYLIVGAGLFGATFAEQKAKQGCSVLVIDKRRILGGTAGTEIIDGIQVHKYGPHIFHTSDRDIWKYINEFGKFNNFVNSPIANYKGKLFALPFNMNTFYRLWNTYEPKKVEEIICKQREKYSFDNPKNLEEQALMLVGEDVYEYLIKGYTEKQWGKPCNELPPEIIKRIPIRMTFDSNYFNDIYQGIPERGYTAIVEKMLSKCDIILNVNYLEHRVVLDEIAKQIVYTGPIDEFYNYRFGKLEYRSLRFETERVEEKNVQGVAVMNFTDADTPFTRQIEHKWFSKRKDVHDIPHTIITREYPEVYEEGKEPYYSVNDKKNDNLFEKYLRHASIVNSDVLFGGRLGSFKYMNMDETIKDALAAADRF